jgi:hypothetical protein
LPNSFKASARSSVDIENAGCGDASSRPWSRASIVFGFSHVNMAPRSGVGVYIALAPAPGAAVPARSIVRPRDYLPRRTFRNAIRFGGFGLRHCHRSARYRTTSEDMVADLGGIAARAPLREWLPPGSMRSLASGFVFRSPDAAIIARMNKGAQSPVRGRLSASAGSEDAGTSSLASRCSRPRTPFPSGWGDLFRPRGHSPPPIATRAPAGLP